MTASGPLLTPRIARHSEIESELRQLRDEELLRWLSVSQVPAHGHGEVSMPLSGAKVFVKLVPVTALELEAQLRHSTLNVFGLPTYYQYRLGGCGFGVWRELEAHRMANQWVLSGECPQFPLLHGWRIVPIPATLEAERTTLKHWGSDPAIQRRVSAVEGATSSAAMFLEYFPRTLGQRFRAGWQGPADRLADAREAERALLEPLSFMHAQGFLHMDAHFENYLTDGNDLFLGDFGLATSRTFRLGAEEVAFFEMHRNFDRCTVISSHVHALVTRYDPKEDWRGTLRELIDGSHARTEEVPVAVRSYLAHRGPVALAMGDFYRRLLGDLRTEYPATNLQRLLDDIEQPPFVRT